MTMHAVLLAVLIPAAATTTAPNQVSLELGDRAVIVDSDLDACADGVLIHNHDDTFENVVAWQYSGVVPPYYGALAEGYDLGAGTVYCGVYWVTTVPCYFTGQSADCFVWEGGVSTPPGTVLGATIGVVFESVPDWPGIGVNEIGLNVHVSGAFTVGYWGNWPGAQCGYWSCADLSGPSGHPWTCIAPGIGYPSGWQDPSIVWGPTASMGIGVYFGSDPSSIQAQTWGSVKALFR
jgi:hypothetical protein